METFEHLPADGRITLIAEFTALPGQGDEVATRLAEYAALVRAEPGNIAFDGYRRLDDPSRFVVYEIYADRAAFRAHMAAPYNAAFGRVLEPLIVEPNSILSFLGPIAD